MAEVKITNENFDNEVLKSDKPVLIDFWAQWCPPCRMLAPIVSEIAKDYDGKVKVGKVNIDEEQELAVKFGIESIPTVMVFKNGKATAQTVGLQPKENLEALLFR